MEILTSCLANDWFLISNIHTRRLHLADAHMLFRQLNGHHFGDWVFSNAALWLENNLLPDLEHTELPLSRQKNPDFRRTFPDEIKLSSRTNAHLLIQILREHHLWKMNYSTNKVQVSFFCCTATIKFPKYANSLTLGLFPDFSQIP